LWNYLPGNKLVFAVHHDLFFAVDMFLLLCVDNVFLL
jgi:hypothetical protein